MLDAGAEAGNPAGDRALNIAHQTQDWELAKKLEAMGALPWDADGSSTVVEVEIEYEDEEQDGGN